VVAIWNTFDQLPDPRSAVHAAARLLRVDGTLAIRVPNGAAYDHWRSRLRSRWRPLAVWILAYNNLLTFPYRFGFSPGSLARLLVDLGFRVDRVVGDILVPTADEWTRTWAAVEERALKRFTRGSMPWFEIYATKLQLP
jgi:hypothetical protein